MLALGHILQGHHIASNSNSKGKVEEKTSSIRLNSPSLSPHLSQERPIKNVSGEKKGKYGFFTKPIKFFKNGFCQVFNRSSKERSKEGLSPRDEKQEDVVFSTESKTPSPSKKTSQCSKGNSHSNEKKVYNSQRKPWKLNPETDTKCEVLVFKNEIKPQEEDDEGLYNDLRAGLYRGFGRIQNLKNSEGKSIYLISDGQIQAIDGYIRENIDRHILEAEEKGEAILIHADESQGLYRSLVITPEGDVFLLFNRKKQGDQQFSGVDKKVSRSIHLNTGKIYASAGIITGGVNHIIPEQDFSLLPVVAEEANEVFLKENEVPHVLVSTHKLNYQAKGSDKVRRFSPFQNRGDLAHALKKGLEKGEEIKIAREIAEGLFRMHQLDMAHRDIKPENILLGENGAVLTDFGTSGKKGHIGDRPFNPSYDKAIGTNFYIAPDPRTSGRGALILDVTKQEKEVDMWALGLVYLQLFFNVSPDDLERNRWDYSVLRQSIQNKVLELKGQHRNNPYFHLIERMLDENPATRLTAEELVFELDKITARLPAPPLPLRD